MSGGGIRGVAGRGRRPGRIRAFLDRPRWRRHGLIRPTPSGLLLAALAGALWYAALLMDDRALVGAALAAMIAWVWGLALAVAQYALIRADDVDGVDDADAFATGRPGERDVTVRARGWRRLLLPHRVCVSDRHVRLDMDGACVRRFVGGPSARRGWYRRLRTVARWDDPFGLFAVRRPLLRGDDYVLLPDPAAVGSRARASVRRRGPAQDEHTGGVRDYAPGDPPRLIAWRHSAHLGTLMTRETGLDAESAAVIAVDTAGADPDAVDAAVREAMAMLPEEAAAWRSEGRGGRIALTDGRALAEDRPHALRLLAALAPAPGADDDVARRAEAIADLAARGGAAVTLLTDRPQGALAGALRARVPDSRLNVVRVPAAQPGEPQAYERIALRLPDGPAVTGESKAPVAAAARPVAGRADEEATDDEPHARHRRIAQAVAAAALLALFLLTLDAFADIAAPTGWWPWFAAAVLAMIAVESSIRWRTALRGACRVLATALAVAFAAAAVVTARIHAMTGVWLFDRGAVAALLEGWAAADPADVPVAAVAVPSSGAPAWRVLAAVLGSGFEGLRAQLPPLDVDPAGDVFLIVLCALVAVIVRCLLFWRSSAPGVALPAVVALGADYGLVGHGAAWWQIALAALAFAALLWARGPWRALPATGAVSAALTVALTLAATPASLNLAYAVPLSFGSSGGLFSSTTINPMIDLKRSLDKGSSAIAFTYTADRRLYMRMTTLGSFDGDTWRFDDALARDGAFYGSVIQLGRDSSNMMSGEERWRGAFSPVQAYLALTGEYAGYGGYEAAQDYSWWSLGGSTVSSIVRGRGYASLDSLTQRASVTIRSLNSRFLPVPGITRYVNGAGGWSTYSDGTVYNREGSAAQGVDYSAYGTYLDPIVSPDGFAQVESIHAWGEALTADGEPDAEDWRLRRESRRALVDAGIATAEDGWIVMPVELRDDGAVLGADGTTIGSFDPLETERDLVLDPDFCDRVHLGGDESFVVAFRGEDQAAIALWSDDPAVTLAGRDSIVVPAPDGSGTAVLSIQTLDAASAVSASLSYISYMLYLQDPSIRNLVTYEGGTSGAYPAFDGSDARTQALRMLAASEAAVHERYTTLPDELPASIRSLADRAGAAVADAADGYDRQVAAMRWLVDYFTDPANGFTYTLDAPDGDGRDNLETVADFLDARAGYCSHYAAALAVLGRALGVPTRMVLGYAPGSGDPEQGDGSYAVAAGQLHSWTEAYIDGVGWVPFDVTPASPDAPAASDADTAGETQPLGLVDPSPADPDADAETTGGSDADALGTDAGETDGSDATASASPAADGQGGVRPPAMVWAVPALAACTLLAAVPGLVRRRRRRLRLGRIAAGRGGGAAARRAWTLAWREVTDTAWDCGLRWSADDTDRDVARRIADAVPDAAAAGTIVGIAERAVAAAFGGVFGGVGAPAASGGAGDADQSGGPDMTGPYVATGMADPSGGTGMAGTIGGTAVVGPAVATGPGGPAGRIDPVRRAGVPVGSEGAGPSGGPGMAEPSAATGPSDAAGAAEACSAAVDAIESAADARSAHPRLAGWRRRIAPASLRRR